jgi:hypothetical protein
MDIGYVEDGYVDGDAVIYDPSLASKKKVNFVIDNQGLSDENISALLLAKHGDTYVDDVNIIFGNSIKVAEKVGGLFSIKEIVGGISQTDLDAIYSAIPTAQSLVSNSDFITNVATSVMSMMAVNIVAQNGSAITSSLVYDDDRNAYVLDYDTSLLDGTNYTIVLKLQ